MTEHRYRARRAVLPSGARTWTVCEPTGLPFEVVEEYLTDRQARGASENTLETYARHLAYLFTWLDGHRLNWETVTLSDLSAFMHDMAAGAPLVEGRSGSGRAETTIKNVAAAVKGFYDFQRVENDKGPTKLRLSKGLGRKRIERGFMTGISKRFEPEANVLRPPGDEDDSNFLIINGEEDFASLSAQAFTYRDRLLLSAGYDMGLRIGQALGLRHDDLSARRHRVRVEQRDNGSPRRRSKRKGEFSATDYANRFFSIYADYLIKELEPAGIDNEFVFVNLRQDPVGEVMSYSNAYGQIIAIATRAGLEGVTWHTLRHSHATNLARAGWTAAEIAERLGQTSEQSAQRYIHLVEDDLSRRMHETRGKVWPGFAWPTDEHRSQ